MTIQQNLSLNQILVAPIQPEAYFDEDTINTLSYSSLLAKSGVPEPHRRIADSFMIIKKIFGFPVVKGKITLDEVRFLAKYDFNTLEFSTVKQVNEEIKLLQKWCKSADEELQSTAEELIQIRSKELKYLIASKYIAVSNEIYNGYRALEIYFEDISKYNR